MKSAAASDGLSLKISHCSPSTHLPYLSQPESKLDQRKEKSLGVQIPLKCVFSAPTILSSSYTTFPPLSCKKQHLFCFLVLLINVQRFIFTLSCLNKNINLFPIMHFLHSS